jgi:hypothetical protein
MSILKIKLLTFSQGFKYIQAKEVFKKMFGVLEMNLSLRGSVENSSSINYVSLVTRVRK